MKLNNQLLPWVDKVKYLGTIICNKKNKLEDDMIAKRATYIYNVLNIIQEFKWAHPGVKNNINALYNGNVYGSNLHISSECQRI